VINSKGNNSFHGATVLQRVVTRRPSLFNLALFIMAYLLGAGFAQLLADTPNTGISMWPPSGLFIATLILARRASWPWWVAAGLAAELAADALWFGNPLPVALAIFAGNALEAVVAALLVRRFQIGPLQLETLREVMVLVVVGAVIAPMVSATIGSLTLAWYGIQSFTRAWPLWWVGDATGVLLVAPLVLAVLQNWRGVRRLSGLRILEALVLLTIFIGASVLALRGAVPMAFMIMPPLLWAAVRFELKGAVVLLLTLALLTAVMAVGDIGQPSAVSAAGTPRSILQQLFLAVSAFSALVVAALSRQYQLAIEKLNVANAELERRVEERTERLRESEARLASVLDALPIGVALIDAGGKTILGNEVFRKFTGNDLPSRDDARYEQWEGYDDKGRRLERRNYPGERALRGERVWPGQEFLFHGDELRGPIWTRVAALPFLGEKDEAPGAIGVVSDIDAEKRARDALRESELRLKLALSASRAGSWSFTDRNGDFTAGHVTWDEGFKELYGFPPDTVPSFAAWTARLHPDDRSKALADHGEFLNRHGRDEWDVEFRAEVPGKETVWVQSMGRVQRDSEGHLTGMSGINFDITERKQAEVQMQLLMHEVNHRSKNMLGLVQAIARHTVRERKPEFLERFQQRIQALAASQDLLVNKSWSGVILDELIRSQLAHFKDALGKRIKLSGPLCRVNAQAAQALGMALHELATNAVKYGALSNARGKVDVTWTLSGTGDDARFAIAWIEHGGPKVRKPKTSGFGSTVIGKMSQLALQADVKLSLAPEGVTWRLECAARQVVEEG
jgi:PAS domain S-box-containing protein